MRLLLVIGILLMSAFLGLASPARAGEMGGTALQPFMKETNYMSVEGFIRWQNTSGAAFAWDTQYMSPVGHARWQYYLESKSWVGLTKAAVFLKVQREAQKKLALEKAAILRFLGDIKAAE